jgi:hypothetical protein
MAAIAWSTAVWAASATAQSRIRSSARRVVFGWVMSIGSFAGRAPRAVAAAVVPKAFGSGVGGAGSQDVEPA